MSERDLAKQYAQHAQSEERCVMCGRPATTFYPPHREESEPSCGRVACELQMQAAEDFHDDHSG